MTFKSFQERMGLSDQDFINFEQDIINIQQEEEMSVVNLNQDEFVDDCVQEQYELENTDEYSLKMAYQASVDRYYDSMTDEECPF